MSSKAVSTWLPQVVIESILIVVSILVALGLDQWRENNQNKEFVQVALTNFHIELSRNKARIDDAAAFNRGLMQVLKQHYSDGDITSVDHFFNMIESYSPANLQSTAWDTAIATGSLAKMEYNLVTALSLTYSLQSHYAIKTGAGASDLASPLALSENNLKLVIFNSVRYLEETTSMEAELAATYAEAIRVVDEAQADFGQKKIDKEPVDLRDSAHP